MQISSWIISEHLVENQILKILNQYFEYLGSTTLYWATPFKIYTPPVEDFATVYHRGSVNFQMHLPRE